MSQPLRDISYTGTEEHIIVLIVSSKLATFSDQLDTPLYNYWLHWETCVFDFLDINH